MYKLVMDKKHLTEEGLITIKRYSKNLNSTPPAQALGPKLGTQAWVPSLGPKLGSQGGGVDKIV